MRLFSTFHLACSLPLALIWAVGLYGQQIETQSTSALEARLEGINTELAQLAELTLRSGAGNLGWESAPRNRANKAEWAHILFGEKQSFDQIVLVPVLWMDSQQGVQADGFPLEFEIRAGADDDASGAVIASFTGDDALLPRIAPLVIPVESTTASWIQIKATQLSPRAQDGKYSMRLSEVMVFNGEENISLNQTVKVSSFSRTKVNTTAPTKALVDGFTPYVMDAARGEMSPAYVEFFKKEVAYTLSLDLGQTYPVNRMHLHSADLEATVPQIQHADYALPKHMIVEGANQADFSDAVQLTAYVRDTIYDSGPIIPLHFSETNCRYLRLRFPDAYKAPEASEAFRCIGFAEIEVFAQGANVARGKTFKANLQNLHTDGEIEALTDGHNHFGEILSMRDWVEQLARRHALEVARLPVEAELKERYARQQKYLNTLQWALAALAAGTIILILIERNKRQRAIYQTRERIAANLHDELGANLHAIGMLSDLAKDEAGANESLTELVDRIRSLTNRTSAAARYCTDMLETYDLCEDLVEEMKRSSQRLLADTQHQITVEGKEHLDQLKPRKRLDLFLFYQESLANIVRHAKATEVHTRLKATKQWIELEIEDNGMGVDGEAPASLKRRAKLMKAKVKSTRSTSGGTVITLQLKLKKGPF